MKKLLSLILAGLIALTLVSCQKTLDTSSEEAMKKSAQEISATLSPEKKEQFQNSIKGMYMLAHMAASFSNQSEKEVVAKLNKKLDGKTANEVIEIGQDMKRQMNNN